MKRLGLVKPMVTAAGILALYGVGLAQTPSDSHRAASARAHELMSSASCPLPRVTKEKITEDQARDLAQQFADKNWKGFNVVRPLGYGGGYNTMCYQTATSSSARPLVLYSVEYSMDLKNPAGETRNLCVDQFGTVSEFCGHLAWRAQPAQSVRWAQPAPQARKVQPDQWDPKPRRQSSGPRSGISCSTSISRPFGLTRRAMYPTSRLI